MAGSWELGAGSWEDQGAERRRRETIELIISPYQGLGSCGGGAVAGSWGAGSSNTDAGCQDKKQNATYSDT